MSSDNHHSTNQHSRLDDVVLETFNLMQQIINHKMQLQDLIKSGTLHLAKSRYIMGNRSVSTTQLPTEDSVPFNALCKVEHSQQELNGVKSTVFALKRQEPVKRKALNEKQERSVDSNDVKLSSDPVQWFGVLVPQNMRLAQDSFKKALDLTVKIATLQAQLEAYQVEFCSLKFDKLLISTE